MHQPEWNKEKGIALLRLGGLSPVKQKNGSAPEKKGLFSFSPIGMGGFFPEL